MLLDSLRTRDLSREKRAAAGVRTRGSGMATSGREVSGTGTVATRPLGEREEAEERELKKKRLSVSEVGGEERKEKKE